MSAGLRMTNPPEGFLIKYLPMSDVIVIVEDPIAG